MRSVAIIVGGAAGAYEEAVAATRACSRFIPPLLGVEDFVCNDMIAEWPWLIAHAVTLHPHKMPGWLRERRARELPAPERLWCHRGSVAGFTDWTRDWAGSSGLFAVKIARELGHERVILAGVPMTVQGGHFRRRQRWTAAFGFRPAWERRRAELAPYVRSMSGWTQEIFGAPDRAWLAS
jgi:hypothetical protein